MVRLHKLHFVAAVILFQCLCLSCVWGQDAGSQAGQQWKQAQDAFGRSDYLGAAISLEAIIRGSAASTHWLDVTNAEPAPPKQQWLEPVVFMLGAARYNAKDWPNAISVFTKYLILFPRSSRQAQAIFSLAQANLAGAHPDDAIPQLTSLLSIPDYHIKAFLLLVEANKQANRPGDAIALMEKEKTLPNINQDFSPKDKFEAFAAVYH